MMLLNDGMTFKKLNKYLSLQVLGDQSAVSGSGYHKVNLGQVLAIFDIRPQSTRIKQILSTHFCVAVIIGISFSEPAGFSCRPPVKTIEIWDNCWLELAEFYSAVKLSFIKKNKPTVSQPHFSNSFPWLNWLPFKLNISPSLTSHHTLSYKFRREHDGDTLGLRCLKGKNRMS